MASGGGGMCLFLVSRPLQCPRECGLRERECRTGREKRTGTSKWHSVSLDALVPVTCLACLETLSRGPARVWRLNPDTSKLTDDVGQKTGRSRASVVFSVPCPRLGFTGLGCGVASWPGLTQSLAL